MSLSLVHYVISNSTQFDLKKNDLVLMTKSGCEVLSNDLSVGGVAVPNGRGVMNSGNDYTTYTSRNYYFVPDDVVGASISTSSSGYTNYYLLVFRPNPGYTFKEILETDIIDAEIHLGTNTYDFSANELPVLCFVGLTVGWAPNSTTSVNGGTAINSKAAYTINQPTISVNAVLSSGNSYDRWGSVGLSFPLLKTIQAQGQIVG